MTPLIRKILQRLFITVLFFISTELSQAQGNFSVSGKVMTMFEGATVSLSSLGYPDSSKASFKKQSCTVIDGRFQIEASSTELYDHVFLSVNKGDSIKIGSTFFLKSPSSVSLIMDSLAVTAELSKGELISYSTINFTSPGSELYAVASLYEQVFKAIDAEVFYRDRLIELAKVPPVKKDRLDSLIHVRTELRNDRIDETIKFIRQHPESYVSLFYYNSEIIRRPYIMPDTLIAIFKQLDTSIQHSSLGRMVSNKINKRSALQAGKTIPDFTIMNSSAKRQKLSEVSKSSPVLISMWASWCGGCIESFPAIAELQKNFDSTKIQVIFISLDDSNDNWQAAMRKYKMKGFQIRDTKSMVKEWPLADLLNVRYIPQYYLVDKDLKIIYEGFSVPFQQIESLLSQKTIYKN